MALRMAAAAAALLLAWSAPAAAQPRPLAVAAGKAFRHQHSRLELPAQLDGLPRSGVTQLEEDQLDLYANYQVAGRDEIISVYIYRSVSGAVPVWFDRARWALENRPEVYGVPTRLDRPFAFVPPGQAAASGLAATYTVTQGPFRTTAVALAPLGEWLVKVRYSSASLGAEELDRRVKGVLAALKWPRRIPAAPAAAVIADCTTPLAIEGRSTPAPGNAAATMMNALMASLSRDKAAKDAPPSAPVVWCRDATQLAAGAVYRPDEAADRYLIALSDSARGILVQPDAASSLLKDASDEQSKPAWSIELMLPPRTMAFAPQDRLPPPAQTLEILQEGRVIAATPTWGKDRTVDINSSAITQ